MGNFSLINLALKQTPSMILALCALMCLFIFLEPFTRTTAQILNEIPTDDSDKQEVIIPRMIWEGSNPLHITRAEPASLVIIKHTGGKMCRNFESCSKRVREIQQNHIKVQQMADIEYNFLIGGDGRIYVGRDWLVQNEGWPDTIDIAFIGNFTENIPTRTMVSASHRLIALGSATGALDFGHFYIVCHKQTEDTDSPGDNLCSEVHKWRFYRAGRVELVESD